jgi:predicted branched-subunit amino acid permease
MKRLAVMPGAGGLGAALPAVAGHAVLALALGVAGASLGMRVWHLVMMASLVVAGPAPLVLLTAMAGHAPWPGAVLLGALASARHVLYGAWIAALVQASWRRRLLFAMALSDEVFATALGRLRAMRRRQRGPWLTRLAALAYAAWVAGTLLGALAWRWLDRDCIAPCLAMLFALPASFVVLAWRSARHAARAPVAVSAVIAAMLAAAGRPGLAVVAGTLLGAAMERTRL